MQSNDGTTKAQRKQLDRERAQMVQREMRGTLADLRAKIRAAKTRRTELVRDARRRAKVGRVESRERIKLYRAARIAEIRAEVARMKQEAREYFTRTIAEARAEGMRGVELAELAYRERQSLKREMARAEAHGRKLRTTHVERRQESDDEVRGNIPPEWLDLFERIKSRIRASGRKSRTEAFFEYVHDHPREVLEATQDASDAYVRQLEREQHRLAKAVRSRRPLKRASGDDLSDVPF